MNLNMEMDLSTVKKQQLVGFIIRKERMKKGIKLVELAKNVGMSKQYVSEIENGTKNISYSAINDICSYLNIQIKFEFTEKVEDDFSNFAEYFYYRDLENAKNRLVSIIKHTDYSFSYPTVCLAEFVYEVMQHKKEIDLEEIEQLNSLIPEKNRCVYFYFRGAYEYKLNHIDEAFKYLKTALDLAGFFSKFEPIIKSYMALIYDRDNDIMTAIQYNQNAYHSFISNGNFERAITNELHIGNEFLKLFLLNDAVNIYKKILKESKRVGIIRIVDITYYNLAVAYLYKQDYESAIETAENGIKLCKNTSDLYFILSWAYYELGNQKQSIMYLNKLKQSSSITPYLDYIIKIQDKRLCKKESTESYIDILQEFYKYNISNEMAMEQIFSLKLIIEYYEKIKDYKNAFIYNKQLLAYYQFH